MLFISIGIVFLLLIVAVAIRMRRLWGMGGNNGEQTAKRWALTPRNVCRATVHCIVLIGVFFILLTRDNQYDWMCGEEEWNGTPPESCSVPDDPSGSGVLFAGALLTIMVAVQLILAARANNGGEVALPAIFIILAICAWLAA